MGNETNLSMVTASYHNDVANPEEGSAGAPYPLVVAGYPPDMDTDAIQRGGKKKRSKRRKTTKRKKKSTRSKSKSRSRSRTSSRSRRRSRRGGRSKSRRRKNTKKRKRKRGGNSCGNHR